MERLTQRVLGFTARMQAIFDSIDDALGLSNSGGLWGVVFASLAGEIDENTMFIIYMDVKFPGLREVLDDRFASLYLNSTMYRMALDFLQAQIDMSSEDIFLTWLASSNNLRDAYILSAISHLVSSANVRNEVLLMHRMADLIEHTRVNNGADAIILNNQLMEAIRINSDWYVKMIARDGFHAWQERNKFFLSVAADMVTGLARTAVVGSSMQGVQSWLGAPPPRVPPRPLPPPPGPVPPGTAAAQAGRATASPARNTVGGLPVGGRITGYTHHGKNQALGRDGGIGVSNNAIMGAVNNPVKPPIPQSGGRVKYVGQDATVVLNQSGQVITTWARNSAGVR